MSARVLSGKEVAAAIDARTIAEVARLQEGGTRPCLAVLRVGERRDDVAYERSAVKRCAAVGVDVRNVCLAADAADEAVIAALERLDADERVHGVLMCRPLAKRFDEERICGALSAQKDVDAMTRGSLASVFAGDGPGYAPCTPQAVMEILAHYGIEVAGKRVCVIGRSLVVGRPVAMLLLQADATPAICHTKTPDVPAIAREADIVVVAAGHVESIGAEHFRGGQTVIDVGIGWSEEKGKLCGDVKFDEVAPIVDAITPVPGGVGAVTTSVLCAHVVDAARWLGAQAQGMTFS